MTAFRTCKNCVLEKGPCNRAGSLKEAIRGMGLTSVKFLCKEREPLFAVGQRVSVTWPVPDYDDEYANSCTLETWPATVIQEAGSRFLIKVDDVRSDNDTPASGFMKNASLYAKVPAVRLKPLDEPVAVICASCGRVGSGPIGDGGCSGYAGSPGMPAFTPYRCAAKLAEQAA